ncbi:MAG: GDSL-type esterase/lipase family protein, partial [Planctomycetota bacterium]|nr:GDSL-type esterase/lipase family protein [Planctomycetota bacterium]
MAHRVPGWRVRAGLIAFLLAATWPLIGQAEPSDQGDVAAHHPATRPATPHPASAPATQLATKPAGSPTEPAPREGAWMQKHEHLLAATPKGPVDVLFLGDSITAGWAGRGKRIWGEYYAPLHAVNLGISGDRTQHVLWRLNHGEVEFVRPKVVVIMIGTNNGPDSVEATTRGVLAVVKSVQAKLPEAKILLLGIFPRGGANDPPRVKNKKINQSLAKLDDGKGVRYLDLAPVFLEHDGSITKEIMPDGLHPSADGYVRW